MKHILTMRMNYLILFCFLFNTLSAQGIPIGQWRDHVSYNSGVAVADAGNRIYCATNSSLFYFNREDNSVNRMTKINGLSDIGISALDYHENTRTLVIAYNNSNIDLLANNRIINISDIKRKNIPGKKNINRITFHDNYAYLSTGFGIVELDLKRHEIRNTYHIGIGGEHIEVFNLTYNDSLFMAATEKGVFMADKNAPNLGNFEYWHLDTTLAEPLAKYSDIAYYGQKLIVNKSGANLSGDTILYFENGGWHYFDTIFTNKIHAMTVSKNRLVLSYNYYVRVFDESFNQVRGVFGYNNTYAEPRYAILDVYGSVWIADKRMGLVYYAWEESNRVITPNGPPTNNVFKMHAHNGELWVAPGLRDASTWNNMWNQDGIFSFIDGKWEIIDKDIAPALDTIHDIVSVIVDPDDSKRLYAATWRRGLLEFYDRQFVNIYTDINSPLSSINQMYWIGVGGLAFDNDRNLWMTNSSVSNAITVKTKNNQWFTFNFPALLNDNVVGEIVIDDYNQKWAILGRGHGLLVFSHNNTLANTGDDKAKKLTGAVGNGNLPSMLVTALAKDRNGEIWVGTDKGIAVFYSPGNVFTNNNFDAQQILVEFGGYNQYLLESETVTAIAVDGANRKWVGTSTSGVFLLSADGTEQLLHFTELNSPLFSDNIKDICIDHESGEVFFGTSNGIISYKGTATKGEIEYSNVYAYPNPVRPNYNGFIAIKGLVTDVDVRITDVAGNLVYSTIAEGGQAVWNGRTLNGDRVASGVYLVFCSNTDGSKTFVTKILFLN